VLAAWVLKWQSLSAIIAVGKEKGNAAQRSYIVSAMPEKPGEANRIAIYISLIVFSLIFLCIDPELEPRRFLPGDLTGMRSH
jgi:hypothetical protein